MIEFCAKKAPRWHAVSISGYHIREAGSTAVQELAFTIADGICYVEEAVKRGLNVDDFAPRLSFFWNLHNDFLEEVAKLRAARRMWARIMKERFGAKNPRSMMLRTHAQTAGVSLTAQQPINNVVRVAIQALAGVMGGVQSLHTNSMDETLALPTEQRGDGRAAHAADHRGGDRRHQHDRSARRQLRDRGADRPDGSATRWTTSGRSTRWAGWSRRSRPAIRSARSRRRRSHYQRQLENREKTVVGVNKYTIPEEIPIETLKIDPALEEMQVQRVRKIKRERNTAAVNEALARVAEACRSGENLMEPICEAVRRNATVGEICDVFRAEFGIYTDPGWI